jgi:hypothetical protein
MRRNAIASACSTRSPTSSTTWAIGIWRASLKPKHVERLVERWKAEGPRRRHNQESDGRASMVGREDRQAECRRRDNEHYGIGNRQYVTNVSKARELTARRSGEDHRPIHADVAAPAGGIRLAARGVDQDPSRVGGSRRQACAEGHLDQRRTRARDSLSATRSSARCSMRPSDFAGRGSLIPAGQRYVDQLRRFEYQCASAGNHRVHGHRHQYAQTRYRELTGWAGARRPADRAPKDD